MKRKNRIITESDRQADLIKRQKAITESFNKEFNRIKRLDEMELYDEASNYPAGAENDPRAPYNQPNEAEYVGFELDDEWSDLSAVRGVQDLDAINLKGQVTEGGDTGIFNVTLLNLAERFPNDVGVILAYTDNPESNSGHIDDLMSKYFDEAYNEIIDDVDWEPADEGDPFDSYEKDELYEDDIEEAQTTRVRGSVEGGLEIPDVGVMPTGSGLHIEFGEGGIDMEVNDESQLNAIATNLQKGLKNIMTSCGSNAEQCATPQEGIVKEQDPIGDDNYNGQLEQIKAEISQVKSKMDGTTPPTVFFNRDGQGLLYLSGEDGQYFADYYGELSGDGYPTIDERLEAIADKYGTYWEWENAGVAILAPI